VNAKVGLPTEALDEIESATVGNLRMATERRLVSLNFTSWNRIGEWLRQLGALRAAA